MDPTPPSWAKDFSSAYRLTLRALSASVRHHPTATKNLRKLYRPTFREAATKFRQHTEAPSEETRVWLQEWNSRLDRTLELLLSSSTTAGPLNRFVSNLSMLTDAYHTRLAADTSARQKLVGEWDGQDLSKNIAQATRNGNKAPAPKDKLQLSAWSALGELALVAENDIRVLIGRQEQRTLSFARMSVHRRSVGSPKRSQRHLYNFVGKFTRPRGLKF